MDTRLAAGRWADTWVPAWKAHDVEAVVALYAEECVHRSAPFRPVHRGRAGLRGYLTAAFADESAVVDVRFTAPLVDGDRAWVEYRVVLRDRDGEPVTLAGSAVARFDEDGLIVESRDYWHEVAGEVPPPGDRGDDRAR
jgi:ketosteroid isomerase-like protein